MGKFEMETAG